MAASISDCGTVQFMALVLACQTKENRVEPRGRTTPVGVP